MEESNHRWFQSRREFFKNSSLIALGVNLPWMIMSSCDNDEIQNGLVVLKQSQYSALKKIHNILFPRDQYGPGADDLNSVEYLDWVLSDKYIEESDRDYMLNGIDWMEESSEEYFSRNISDLNNKELEELISTVSKEAWGESWLSRNITYILEANFSDELYGSNIGGEGWKWLNHYPGFPRPKSEYIYDQIFDTVSNLVYNKL